MKNREQLVEQARRRLLHGMDRTASGTWAIWSEHAVERLLDVVQGKFEDAVEHALSLTEFFEYGAGGRLERVEVKRLPNLAERRRLEEARKQQLSIFQQTVYEGVERIPLVGEDIYIPTRMYIDHGEDDICGGLARVTRVDEMISAGKPAPMISVAEVPDRFNWVMLEGQQDKLREEFGTSRAYPDPDYG